MSYTVHYGNLTFCYDPQKETQLGSPVGFCTFSSVKKARAVLLFRTKDIAKTHLAVWRSWNQNFDPKKIKFRRVK